MLRHGQNYVEQGIHQYELKFRATLPAGRHATSAYRALQIEGIRRSS
jgi:hypothetical protein